MTLWSYVSYRDLRVLYFDGSSAALGDIGVSDAQEVFIARRGGVVGGHGWFDDYTRLKSLCAWAKVRQTDELDVMSTHSSFKGKGIDGFVRMNTGFELMKCDFEAGLNLVSRLNITPPDTMKIPLPRPPRRDVTLLDMADDTLTMPASHTTVAPGAKPPPGPPGRHPEGWRSAPLMATSRFEWARVAVHRAFNPQPSIELLTSGLVTFYDPNLASLTPLRQNTPMYQHRVWNISSQDAERVMERVEAIVRKGDVWSHRGIQWNAVAQRVVDAWGDRLAQINETLREPTVKPSEVVERVRLISYTLLNPYLDTTQLPYGNQSDPELWLSETVSRCSDAYTGFILPTTLTQEEQILKASINSVVGRLCRYAGKALAATLGKEGDDQLVTLIRRDTERLLRWLDWPIWLRCEEDCGPHVSLSFTFRRPSDAKCLSGGLGYMHCATVAYNSLYTRKTSAPLHCLQRVEDIEGDQLLSTLEHLFLPIIRPS